MNEEFLAIYGWCFKGWFFGYGSDYTMGSMSQVTGDFDKLWNKRKKLIGFWHTHPQWVASPSWTDFETMNAMTCTFGKSLLCLISGTDGKYCFNYRVNLMADSVPDPKTKFYKLGNLFWGKI
jgi:proteasome lid subunit RPN8/RPN11